MKKPKFNERQVVRRAGRYYKIAEVRIIGGTIYYALYGRSYVVLESELSPLTEEDIKGKK